MKLLAVLALVILAGIYYYVALPALNIHSTEFWIFLIVVIVAAAFFYAKRKRFDRYALKESKGMKVILGILGAVVIVYAAGTLLSSPIVNAKKYQKLMKVEDGEFTKDIEELSLIRFRCLTEILRRSWETERWEVWWIWSLSLR